MKFSLIAVACIFGLTACAVGPDYQRPELSVPAHYKELPQGWKMASPADDVARGPWWESFADPVLNDLMQTLNQNNLSIKSALANYDSARAALGTSRADLFPSVNASGKSTRSSSAGGTDNGGTIGTRHSASLDASWELDLWGKVRRNVEVSEAQTQASAADLAGIRLSSQATLVQNYIMLRVTDQLIVRSQAIISSQARTLAITQSQYAAGLVTQVDVLSAQTQVSNAKANLLDSQLSRQQYEHAIAILLGKAPADFNLSANNQLPSLPQIPVTLPSDLLERRPDIASAERNLAAANARIGVAQAAYYPSFSLSASAGSNAAKIADLFSAPAQVWSLGASLTQAIFDAGKRSSQVDAAKANFEGSVAQYRLSVLTALQEIEDNLAAMNYLTDELAMRQQALLSAKKAEEQALNSYQAGLVDFTTVATNQIARYQAETAIYQLEGRRYTAMTVLIKALGGGWDGTI